MVRLDAEAQRRAESLAKEEAAAARSAGLEANHLGTLCDGSIWSEILRVADERSVAAVMVGSRGLSDIRSILLGSVSSGVAHHSNSPVVVVRGPSVRP
jgi:nucleotide-binding universal stress UspA family protein